MAIRINDDMDDFEALDYEEMNDTITQEIDNYPQADQYSEEIPYEDSNSEIDPVIQELLYERGIEDTSRIKFENEDGEIEELDWNSLSNEDKLGILQPEIENTYDPEEGLDDTEIQLINAIRSSKMTPQEYINYVQQTGVNSYIQNQSLNQYQYQIDDYDDNTLYVMDLIARGGDNRYSDQELEDALINAQANPVAFQKQVSAIREEYKQKEDENRRQIAYNQQQQQINQYNQFAENIENEIRNLRDVGGYDLNMDEDEMEELYEFITGFDAAGVSIFGKALNNPKLLVKMGWWALHGDEAIQDINDYWTNEIRNISKNTRKEKNKVQIVNRNKPIDSFDGFDDEF